MSSVLWGSTHGVYNSQFGPPSPQSFSFNFPHERESSRNFVKKAQMDTHGDQPEIKRAEKHKQDEIKREKREHYFKQKHQYSDHQRHHNRTTEECRARTDRRGSWCVMWPSSRPSSWALSVCSGLLGRRGWPSWTNWFILTCIPIFWVMRNHAFKRGPFPIDCGFGVCVHVCVCVFTTTFLISEEDGCRGNITCFCVKCVTEPSRLTWLLWFALGCRESSQWTSGAD